MKQHDPRGIVFYLLRYSRIFLGLIFIFSSTVKGIDPLGTSYRVEDYLANFGWGFLMPHALLVSYIIIISEFLLGIAFLFKLFFKKAVWLMLLMLSFFTVLTFFDALKNLVPDCGCFGDAIKLSNWATFYKNIVLISLNIFVLVYARKLVPRRPRFFPQFLILVITGTVFLGFMNYNLNHLPIIDFRNWKVGENMKPTGLSMEKKFVVYKNRKTGETKEFLFPNFPWKDSTWMAQWKFVGQRIDDSQVHKKYNLVLEDSLGNDHAKAIIENPGTQFLLFSYNLSLGNSKGFQKAATLESFLNSKGISMVLITASDRAEISRIENGYHLIIPAFLADETELKAIIRSNPGLMMMRNGIIIKKWASRDFLTPDQVQKYLVSPEH
ncbi:MAG: DoxX family protein [Bacteroidales bacterium]|nr:DoxX family protein [Bacteroidales bacterium]